jgi:hypothetical protein
LHGSRGGSHGQAAWPRLQIDPEPDLEDEDFIRKGQEIPLGAFYRINPFRLDDMTRRRQ